MKKILFLLLAFTFLGSSFLIPFYEVDASKDNAAQTQDSPSNNSGTDKKTIGPADKEIKLMQPLPGQEKMSTGDGAIGIIEKYVKSIFLFGTGLVSLVAVIWIIIGGYEIMIKGSTSGADISSGKDKITHALLGLVLIFLSALILNTINPGFFTLNGGTATDTPSSSQTQEEDSSSTSSSSGEHSYDNYERIMNEGGN